MFPAQSWNSSQITVGFGLVSSAFAIFPIAERGRPSSAAIPAQNPTKSRREIPRVSSSRRKGESSRPMRNRAANGVPCFGPQYAPTALEGERGGEVSATGARNLSTAAPRQVAVKQSSMRLTIKLPEPPAALIRTSTWLSPGLISVVMSAEYH